jgi:hypothetical protein
MYIELWGVGRHVFNLIWLRLCLNVCHVRRWHHSRHNWTDNSITSNQTSRQPKGLLNLCRMATSTMMAIMHAWLSLSAIPMRQYISICP